MEHARADVVAESGNVGVVVGDAGREHHPQGPHVGVVDPDAEAVAFGAQGGHPTRAELDGLVARQIGAGGAEQGCRVTAVEAEIAVELLRLLVARLAGVDDERAAPVPPEPQRGGETGDPAADDDRVVGRVVLGRHYAP